MLPPINDAPMNTQMSIGSNDNGGNMNDFDNEQDFETKSDANSETDPKKYIQQLTGKLSQELRKFNQEDDNQDNELNKYVLGMLIPQATKSMNDSDKNEIVKKIQKGDVDNLEDENSIDNINTSEDMPLANESKLSNNTIDSLSKETKKYRLKKKIKVNNNPFIIDK